MATGKLRGSFDGFEAGVFQLTSLLSPKRVGIGVWFRLRTRRLSKGRWEGEKNEEQKDEGNEDKRGMKENKTGEEERLGGGENKTEKIPFVNVDGEGGLGLGRSSTWCFDTGNGTWLANGCTSIWEISKSSELTQKANPHVKAGKRANGGLRLLSRSGPRHWMPISVRHGTTLFVARAASGVLSTKKLAISRSPVWSAETSKSYSYFVQAVVCHWSGIGRSVGNCRYPMPRQDGHPLHWIAATPGRTVCAGTVCA